MKARHFGSPRPLMLNHAAKRVAPGSYVSCRHLGTSVSLRVSRPKLSIGGGRFWRCAWGVTGVSGTNQTPTPWAGKIQVGS